MKVFPSVIILLLLCFSISFAKDYKKDFSHTFKVSEGVTIILDNGDGDVHIETWEKDEIAVEVIYHASSKYAGEKDILDFEVEFDQKGNDVYIIGHEYNAKMSNFFSFKYLDYSYKISAPAYTNLEIKSSDGDIEIQSVTGDIDCKVDDGDFYMADAKNNISRIFSEDGSVRIEKHSGNLNINTGDGDVTVESTKAKQVEISTQDGRIKVRDSAADFFVDSNDGNITLINISGKEIDARSGDGDVDIIFDGEGPVDFIINTDDGRVNIELNNPVSALFSIESGDGHIRFDAPDSNILRDDEHYLKGELGNGDGRIKVRTSDGSISLSTNF